MDLGLKDKVAVITGGDSGIGKATAEILLQEGAKVAILNRTPDHLEEAIESLKPYGTAFPLQADITQLDQVEAVKKKVMDEYGTVHILVHCAGITGATGDFLSIDDDGWEKTIAIDLMGAVRCCRAFIPPMRENGWGRVVLLGSEDAEQPYIDDMPYCACKAGILNLAKNLSKAYGQDGVLVNSVGPAFVESPMTNAMMDQRAKEQNVSREEAVQSFLKENRPFIELKRRGQPEEVAAVIAFLCSERASYVLGSNWRVDGGSVATVG